MAKDTDILQAVRDQDVHALEKILGKHKNKPRLVSSSKKLNVNYQDEDGMSALHQAALQGNVDCMKLLLECGASPDIKDNKGMRPLHYAAWQGLLEPVTLLMSHEASPRDAANDGDTPLHFASQHGHLDVVQLLLHRGADPTVRNCNRKTSLDLACEFGRYKVAEHLILSGLCDSLLNDLGGRDLADSTRTTCLHLAAKNGHTDIISLLLQADVDINHQTAQGTALHEAALYGKTSVVRLLIEKGIDINLPNSFDQTALDIVNKFTKKAGSKELKALLTDASCAVRARAVKDYANPYDPQSLSLRVGDIVTVLEQRPDGISRGFLANSGSLTRAAYFPSNCVTVLDKAQSVVSGERHAYSGGVGTSGKPPEHDMQLDVSHAPLYGRSTAEDGTPLFSPPPLYRVPDPGCAVHYQYPPPSSPLCMAAIPEDRANAFDQATISRHSASSRDSRGSATHYTCGSAGGSGHSYPHSIASQQRLSGQNYESGLVGTGSLPGQQYCTASMSSARQSINSVSSCCSSSLDGSAERLLESVGSGESSGYSSGSVNVAELFMQGLSDSDVLHTWLSELHYEGYYDCFMDAGYDMATISRMTPEDLTAIGVTKPTHRRKLKAEISRLNIADGIPEYRPASVAEWLQVLHLEMYHSVLMNGQYDTVEKVSDMIWEDLEDLGIRRLGHQKKMMLAIEKLKRLCKRQSTTSNYSRCSTGYVAEALPAAASLGLTTRWSADITPPDSGLPKDQYSRPQHLQQLQQPLPRACSQPADIVAITVKTGVSRSSSGNSVNSAGGEYAQPRCRSFTAAEKGYDAMAAPSSDDSGSSGGSLPRGRGPLRAIHGMVMAKVPNNDSDRGAGHQQWEAATSMDTVSQYATLRRRSSSRSAHSASAIPCEFTVPTAATKVGFAQPSGTSSLTHAAPTSPCSGTLSSPFANFKSPYAHIQTGQVRNAMSTSATTGTRSDWGSASAADHPSRGSQPQQLGVKKPPPPPRRSNSLTSKLPSDADRDKKDGVDSNDSLSVRGAAGGGDVSPVPSEQDMDAAAFPPLPPPMAFNIQHMKGHRLPRQQTSVSSAFALTSLSCRLPATPNNVEEQVDGPLFLQQYSQSAVETALADPECVAGAAAARMHQSASGTAGSSPTALSAVHQSGLAIRRRVGSSATSSSAAISGQSDPAAQWDNSCSVSARSSGAGDVAFLPFANENVGTIKQKVAINAAADWQPTGSHSDGANDSDREMRQQRDAGYTRDNVEAGWLSARPVGHVQPVVSSNEGKATDLLSQQNARPLHRQSTINGTVSTEAPVKDVFSDIDCEIQNLTYELELELESMALESKP